MSGGKGLDKFRYDMLNHHSHHFKCFFDYANAQECFPGVHIDGGVNYFVYDKNYDGETKYCYKPENEDWFETKRSINNSFTNVLIRDYRQASIIEKAVHNKESFDFSWFDITYFSLCSTFYSFYTINF